MKVIEKYSDRTAETHICVNGKLLGEYGEYVDEKDKAVCCYVPIEEGQEPSFQGKFIGTTCEIVCDAFIDGILRKTRSFGGQTVHYEKYKRFDVKTFLFKSNQDQDVVNSEVLVVRSDVATTQSESPETIGTMELRVYVTSQIGISHSVDGTKRYFDKQNQQVANYKQIMPTLHLEGEKGTTSISKQLRNVYRGKMKAPRPGEEPWAIFRFHYRTKEALHENGLDLTYDPLSKQKNAPRALSLKRVPLLVAETKPSAEEDSSRTSSSPFLPTTPVSELRNLQKSCTPSKNKSDHSTDSVATAPTSSIKKEMYKSPEPQEVIPKSSPSLDFLKVSSGIASRKTLLKPNEPSMRKVDSKTPLENGSAKLHDLPDPNAAVPANEASNEHSPLTLNAENAFTKPAATALLDKNTQSKLQTPSTATIPSKRSSTTNDISSDPKRLKVLSEPVMQSDQPLIPPSTSRSPTPQTTSLERQLIEQRQKLEELRKARADLTKKQAVLDKHKAIDKQRMVEELERIKREMLEEESDFNEMDRYSAGVKLVEGYEEEVDNS